MFTNLWVYWNDKSSIYSLESGNLSNSSVKLVKND